MQFSKTKRNFLLVLISFMVGVIYFIPYIRFAFYDQTIAALQLTNLQLGNLGAIYGLVALFCYPLGGILTQKFGPKILLTVAFIGTALVTFWQATFPSYNVLLIIYILYAFFTTATLWPPYITFLRSLGTESEQGKMFGISESMRGVVSTIIGFVFVWVFSLFATEIGGFRAILIIGAILYLVFASLALIFLPNNHTENNSSDKMETSSEKGSILAALKLPGVWLVGLFIFSCYSIVAAGINYLGTYTTQVLGVAVSVSSSIAIVRSYIIAILAGIITGIIADKFKYRTKFIIILLSIEIISVIAMIFLSQQVAFAIILSLIVATLYYMIKSVYYSVMGEGDIPLAMTGIASGVISFIAYIPDAFITSLMGAWLDADIVSGFNKIFIWMGIWGIIAIVLAVIINKRHIKYTEENTK